MRDTDPMLPKVLADSVGRRVIADIYVGNERKVQNLDCSVDLSWDGGRKILCTGTVELVYNDDWGRSLTPEKTSDTLAPFASWIDLRYEIDVGGYQRTIPLGRLAVQKPSGSRRQRMKVGARSYIAGESITIKVEDAFSLTERERFVVASQPPTDATAWGELARLTGWPILRNLPDASIPSTIAYQENRLDAVFDLGDALGGAPYLRGDNTLTLRPFDWGAPVATLTDGPDGQIVSYDVDEWDIDQVYNQVVVRASNDEHVVLAEAHVKTGRLRYGLPSEGAWGRFPLYVSSEFITTNEQAQAYADSRLLVVSQLKARIATIAMLPDPRLEVGDVVNILTSNMALPELGRIQTVKLPKTGPMTIEVRLA